MSVAISDVDHSTVAVAECDVRGQAGLAQGERDVVAAGEMCLEQRLEREVGQDVTAIGNERLCPEPRLCILDPATGFEQVRLVYQPDRKLAIPTVGEKGFEMSGEMMRVDDERPHAGGREMIESECDKRFLENRDEWLWQVLGQRTEPQAETGAEDEGLGDHMPNDD
jgi:hypothetical protein